MSETNSEKFQATTNLDDFEKIDSVVQPQQINEENLNVRAQDDLLVKSENAYVSIAKDIVETSASQLKNQNCVKDELRKKFSQFFRWFLIAQYLVLVALLVIKSFADTGLTDTVLLAYIASVFVETLGALIVMVKYSFDSSQEVKILEILNGVISSFQKFNKNGKDQK